MPFLNLYDDNENVSTLSPGGSVNISQLEPLELHVQDFRVSMLYLNDTYALLTSVLCGFWVWFLILIVA